MSKLPTYRTRTYTCLPADAPVFDSLAELALDMDWSWHDRADEIWMQLDPTLWELTHNPWVVLQTVSRDQLEERAGRPGILRAGRFPGAGQASGGGVVGLVPAKPSADALDLRCLFQHGIHVERGPAHLLGGFGNVAGDQLKSASDLGVPVVAVGLLYQQGYFRQVIDRDGRSRPSSLTTTPDNCPSLPCGNRTASGCGWRSRCPAIRFGCGPGRSRWAG